MLRRTIEVSTPGVRLSVAHRQLVIDRPEQPKATVPLEDLGVVVVDDTRATYTQAVFIELLRVGAVLMVTGGDHLPAGMMLPLDAHHVQTERHLAQVGAGEPLKKRLWQSLVCSKILQQAAVLTHFTGEHGGLSPMAARVRSGDPENLEAQAAQRYWPLLFGKSFRRDRDAHGINAALNYGYAVVRAAVARSVVAAGLIPSLGVFHSNRANPFCLADDLFEPYRPFVDWRVRLVVDEAASGVIDIGDRGVRAALLSLFNETVVISGKRNPMLIAIQSSATSLARALTGGDRTLVLPKGLPVAPDLLDGFGAG